MTFQECPKCGNDWLDIHTPNGQDGYHAFDFLNLKTGDIEIMVSCDNCGWKREYNI